MNKILAFLPLDLFTVSKGMIIGIVAAAAVLVAVILLVAVIQKRRHINK